jgi:hypothetical protein
LGPRTSPAHAPRTPPAERQLGDERARYGRRGVRDRLGETVDAARAHPLVTLVLVLFVGVVVVQRALPARSALPMDLAVGDCLYVRTTSTIEFGPDARPIGDAASVSDVLLAGGAEQAPCDGSHGHEVSLTVAIAADAPSPSRGADGLPGADDPSQRACVAAFEGYVGHPLDGSLYETFAAVPTAEQRASGITRAICLVARRDGQWLIHPARDSGE